jgi:hypothetical protein
MGKGKGEQEVMGLGKEWMERPRQGENRLMISCRLEYPASLGISVNYVTEFFLPFPSPWENLLAFKTTVYGSVSQKRFYR